MSTYALFSLGNSSLEQEDIKDVKKHVGDEVVVDVSVNGPKIKLEAPQAMTIEKTETEEETETDESEDGNNTPKVGYHGLNDDFIDC